MSHDQYSIMGIAKPEARKGIGKPQVKCKMQNDKFKMYKYGQRDLGARCDEEAREP